MQNLNSLPHQKTPLSMSPQIWVKQISPFLAIVAPHHIKYQRLTPSFWHTMHEKPAEIEYFWEAILQIASATSIIVLLLVAWKGKANQTPRLHIYSDAGGKEDICWLLKRVSILRMLHLWPVYYESSFLFFKLLHVLQYYVSSLILAYLFVYYGSCSTTFTTATKH